MTLCTLYTALEDTNMSHHRADMALKTSSWSPDVSPLWLSLWLAAYFPLRADSNCVGMLCLIGMTLFMDIEKQKLLNGTIVLQEKYWSRSLGCLECLLCASLRDSTR
jgi:hypothetical protein